MANILFISYDNGSHLPFFPQHLFYLVGAVQKDHVVGVWANDIEHGSNEGLTETIDRSPVDFDLVCLGFVAGYYQYAQAVSISQAVNRSKKRSKFRYILGGHGPAADPEFFLRKLEADVVVVGDGEAAIRNLAGNKKTGVMQGFPCVDDEAPIGAYEFFNLDVYRLIRWPTSTNRDLCFPILSSRGCKWHCSFCYRMREGYHMRAVPAIMEEIRWLRAKANINHFQFSDELLMSSEERTAEICEGILGLNFPIKWDCNGRLNYATPGTLSLMKRAGAEYVNYGIESLNQGLLNSMRKGLTMERIYQGVEATLQAGLSPGLNLIWGFPGDTVENLNAAVDFICRYDPCHELRTIRPVTPYPGTDLFRLAVERGLLEGTEDFYENKHKNSDLISVNFMDIPMEEAHFHLKMANRALFRNYIDKRWEQFGEQTRKLYTEGDTSFRGFRDV